VRLAIPMETMETSTPKMCEEDTATSTSTALLVVKRLDRQKAFEECLARAAQLYQEDISDLQGEIQQLCVGVQHQQYCQHCRHCSEPHKSTTKGGSKCIGFGFLCGVSQQDSAKALETDDKAASLLSDLEAPVPADKPLYCSLDPLPLAVSLVSITNVMPHTGASPSTRSTSDGLESTTASNDQKVHACAEGAGDADGEVFAEDQAACGPSEMRTPESGTSEMQASDMGKAAQKRKTTKVEVEVEDEEGDESGDVPLTPVEDARKGQQLELGDICIALRSASLERTKSQTTLDCGPKKRNYIMPEENDDSASEVSESPTHVTGDSQCDQTPTRNDERWAHMVELINSKGLHGNRIHRVRVDWQEKTRGSTEMMAQKKMKQTLMTEVVGAEKKGRKSVADVSASSLGQGLLCGMTSDGIASWCDPSRLVLMPSAPSRVGWSFLGMFLLFYDVITLPMQVFKLSEAEFMVWFGLIYWTLDIFTNFLTGVEKRNHKFEMRIGHIALVYLRTWFIPDVVVTGIGWVIMSMESGAADESSDPQESRMAKSVKLGKLARVLRFVRLIRVAKGGLLMKQALQHVNAPAIHLLISVIMHTLSLVVISHIVACIWFGLGQADSEGRKGWVTSTILVRDGSPLYQYLCAMHWTFANFQGQTDVGSGGTLEERAFAVIILLMALIILTSYVSTITNALFQYQSMNQRARQNIQAVLSFLSVNRVPSVMATRAKQHIAWREHAAEVSELERKVQELLPTRLMMDITAGGSCQRIQRPLCLEGLAQRISDGGSRYYVERHLSPGIGAERDSLQRVRSVQSYVSRFSRTVSLHDCLISRRRGPRRNLP